MAKADEWFVEERSRALTILHLTRRPDLRVVDNRRSDFGPDYLVYLEKDRPTLRQFGVVVRGRVSPVTEGRANALLRPAIRALLRLGEYPYPVCLFYFTMQDNQGYYTWVAEPVVTETAQPRLRMHDTADCHRLNDDAVNQVVARVGAWYDAFFASLTVSDSPG